MSAEDPLSKGEQTKQSILAAAKELILDQGYTATSMRQIAQAVGVTPAALYNHVAGKDELFTLLVREAAPLEQGIDLLQGLQADTPAGLLREAFAGLLGLFASHEDYVRLALIDAQERDGAALATLVPQLAPHILGFARRVQARDAVHGQLRNLPPPVLVRAMMSQIGGYMLTERVLREVNELNLPQFDWAGALLDVYLHGVLRTPDAEEG
jgi:AcrR family transcriptional regulator